MALPQARLRGPRGRCVPGSHLLVRIVAAATGVVVLAGCGVGDPAAAGESAGSASPTATASASPAPTPTPSPTPSPEPPSAQPLPDTDSTPDPVPPPVVAAPQPAPTQTAAKPPAAAPVPVPAPAPAPAAPVSAAPSTSGAQALFSALNGARSAAGLGPLIYSSAMESVASAWSSSMAGSATMGHNPSYDSQIPGGFSIAGENVGYAGGFADNSATIHTGWMNSPGHRDNILRGSFTHVGIGYVVDAAGTAWATQVFAGY